MTGWGSTGDWNICIDHGEPGIDYLAFGKTIIGSEPTNVDFGASFVDPILILGIPSYDDSTPVIVVSSMDANNYAAIRLFQSANCPTSTEHVEEISWMVFENGLVHRAESGMMLQANSLSVDYDRWESVQFKTSFPSDDVVVIPSDQLARIRDVTKDGFMIYVSSSVWFQESPRDLGGYVAATTGQMWYGGKMLEFGLMSSEASFEIHGTTESIFDNNGLFASFMSDNEGKNRDTFGPYLRASSIDQTKFIIQPQGNVCTNTDSIPDQQIGYAMVGDLGVLPTTTTTISVETTHIPASEDGCYQFTTHDTAEYNIVLDSKLGVTKAVTFTVRGSNDAHIGFFSDSLVESEVYEIVISGWGNTQSVIRECAQCPSMASLSTPDLLSQNEDVQFWADAVDGLVRLGTGNIVGDNLLLKWQDPDHHNARFVGFMTGWGSDGQWNACIVEGLPSANYMHFDTVEVSSEPQDIAVGAIYYDRITIFGVPDLQDSPVATMRIDSDGTKQTTSNRVWFFDGCSDDSSNRMVSYATFENGVVYVDERGSMLQTGKSSISSLDAKTTVRFSRSFLEPPVVIATIQTNVGSEVGFMKEIVTNINTETFDLGLGGVMEYIGHEFFETIGWVALSPGTLSYGGYDFEATTTIISGSGATEYSLREEFDERFSGVFAQVESDMGDITASLSLENFSGDAFSIAKREGTCALDADPRDLMLGHLVIGKHGFYSTTTTSTTAPTTTTITTTTTVVTFSTELLEIGTVIVGAEGTRLTWSQTFQDPLLFLGIPSYQGDNHGYARINDVLRKSGSIYFDQSSNCDESQWYSETVSWFVVENNLEWSTTNGATLKSGSYDINPSQYGELNEVTFPNPFDADDIVVLLMLQTHNSIDYLHPRVRSANRNGFYFTLDGTSDDSAHTFERVAYFAATKGSLTFDEKVLQFDLTLASGSGHFTANAMDMFVSPGLFGQVMSYNDASLVNLRYTDFTGGAFVVQMTEDQCGAGDGSHGAEIIGYAIIEDIPETTTTTTPGFPDANYVVSSFAMLSHDLYTISFGQIYFRAPILMLGVPTQIGQEHGHPRIARLENSEASIWFDESDNCDGEVSLPEIVPWAVFESGVQYSSSQGMLQTGMATIASQEFGDYQYVPFLTSFDTDDVVVFATIQTYNGNSFVKTRIRDITRDGFRIALETSPSDWWFGDYVHPTETIGYVAATIGPLTYGGVQFDFHSMVLSDSTQSSCDLFEFDNAAVFGSISSHNGGQPVNLRMNSNVGCTIWMHEDSCADGNDWHLEENVSLFGMEITITPDFTTTAPTTTTVGPTDFPGMPDANYVTLRSAMITHQGQSIDFGRVFVYPVVILGVPSRNGISHGSIRITTLGATSADIFFDESPGCDGTHAEESVSVLIFENGVQFNNGNNILQTGKVALDVADDFYPITFESPFLTDDVVVLASLQTQDSDAYLTVTIRSVSRFGFEISLGEIGSGGTTGIVGWVAATTGTFDYGGEIFEFIKTFQSSESEDLQLITGLSYSFSDDRGLFGQIMTNNDDEIASLRYVRFDDDEFSTQIHEDTCNSADQIHAQEIVGYAAVARSISAITTTVAPEHSYEKLTLGTSSISSNTETSAQISFTNYIDPIVILGLASRSGSHHGSPRISSMDSTSATFYFQETDNCDGTSDVTENVNWAVFENHVSWADQNGYELKTGSIDITTDGPSHFETVTFTTPFSSADIVVIATVQTYNGRDFVKTRIRSVSRMGFEINVEETSNRIDLGRHARETVAWVAAAVGTIEYDGVSLEFGTDQITGVVSSDVMLQNQFLLGNGHDMGLWGQVMSYGTASPVSLRYDIKEKDFISLALDQDNCDDDVAAHGIETIGYMVSGQVIVTTTASPTSLVEYGYVHVDNMMQEVTFRSSRYFDPIVFLGIPTFERGSSGHGVPRIISKSNEHVNILMTEPDCKQSNSRMELVSYLVLENNRIDDVATGSLQTGTYDITPEAVDNVWNSRHWHQVNFHTPFASNDVSVIITIQTRNIYTFLKTRIRNVDADGFQVALELQEGSDVDISGQTETIAWLAAPVSSFTYLGLTPMESNTLYVNGTDRDIFYSRSDNSAYIFGHVTTFYGSDPVTLRAKRFLGDHMTLFLDEDMCEDTEVNHMNELVSYLVITDKGVTTSSTTTLSPTLRPTKEPSLHPSPEPTSPPTTLPSKSPTVSDPTHRPTLLPTHPHPTPSPTMPPSTSGPTLKPTRKPTSSEPTLNPFTTKPTDIPSNSPITTKPTGIPSTAPIPSKTQAPKGIIW